MLNLPIDLRASLKKFGDGRFYFFYLATGGNCFWRKMMQRAAWRSGWSGRVEPDVHDRPLSKGLTESPSPITFLDCGFFAAGKQSISKEQFFVGFVLFCFLVLFFCFLGPGLFWISVSLSRDTCLQLSKSPAMNQIPGAAEEHRRSTDLPLVLQFEMHRIHVVNSDNFSCSWSRTSFSAETQREREREREIGGNCEFSVIVLWSLIKPVWASRMILVAGSSNLGGFLCEEAWWSPRFELRGWFSLREAQTLADSCVTRLGDHPGLSFADDSRCGKLKPWRIPVWRGLVITPVWDSRMVLVAGNSNLGGILCEGLEY